MKTVIVHDWLVGGGAEKVVLELHKMFPDAPIYTSYCSEEWRKKLKGKVITGYLQNLGFMRKFLPILRVWWFRSLDLSKFDLVISSSGNGEAKHIKKALGAKHISYCHSPPHYLWRHYYQYLKEPGFGVFNFLTRIGLKLLLKPLRKADYEAAQNVDVFIANSNHIKNDIRKYYNRDSKVIFPPVEIKRFSKQPHAKREGYITVGRLVPNKRVDMVVDACTQLGVKLKVIGNGPELTNLQKRAGQTVEFFTNASDEQVAKQLAKAKAFLFASFEDFGITPVEALAAGTPVIAYKAGGALDYVEPGKTGEFFEPQSVKYLAKVLQDFAVSKYNSIDIKKASQRFAAENFRQQLQKLISQI